MDFFKENRKYFIYFLTFGLWSSWQKAHYKWQIRLYAICLMLIIFALYIATFIFNKFKSNMSLSTILGHSAFFSMILVQSVISIETFIKTKFQVRFVEKFNSVDHLFNTKLGISVAYLEEKRDILTKILILVLVLLLIKINIYVYVTYMSVALEYFYCTMYSSWLMRMRCIQVLYFVHMVRYRLILIDRELTNIRRAFNCQKVNAKSQRAAVSNQFFGTKFICDRVVFLKQIYAHLNEITGLINTIFGWSLLAIITQNFLDFTLNCYWIFVMINNTDDINVLVICIILLIPNLMTLSMLAFYCSSCRNCVSNIHYFSTE